MRREARAIADDRPVRAAAYVAAFAAACAACAGDPLATLELGALVSAALGDVWDVWPARWTSSRAVKLAAIPAGTAIFLLAARASLGPIAVARFLLWNVLVLILARPKAEANLWILTLLDLVLFASAAAFARPVWFVPLVAAALVALLYQFQRLALIRSGAAARAGLGPALAQAGVAIVFASAIFLLFPRGLAGRHTASADAGAQGASRRSTFDEGRSEEGVGAAAGGATTARPPAGPLGAGGSGRGNDSQPSRWDSGVIDYDPAAQGRVLGGLGSFLTRAPGIAVGFLKKPVTLVAILSLIATAAIAWLFLPRDRKARIRQLLGGFPDQAGADFYRDFLWILSRRGLYKPPGMTGLEFAAIARERAPAAAVEHVTREFYRVAYAGATLSAGEHAAVRAMLAQIEAAK